MYTHDINVVLKYTRVKYDYKQYVNHSIADNKILPMSVIMLQDFISFFNNSG